MTHHITQPETVQTWTRNPENRSQERADFPILCPAVTCRSHVGVERRTVPSAPTCNTQRLLQGSRRTNRQSSRGCTNLWHRRSGVTQHRSTSRAPLPRHRCAEARPLPCASQVTHLTCEKRVPDPSELMTPDTRMQILSIRSNPQTGRQVPRKRTSVQGRLAGQEFRRRSRPEWWSIPLTFHPKHTPAFRVPNTELFFWTGPPPRKVPC